MDCSIHRPLSGSSGRLGCQGVRTVRSCDKLGRSMYCKASFGGAIVTKLAGSAKIVKGEHVVVPLLGPGNGPQPRLPFGASLECIQKPSHHQIPRSEPISHFAPNTSSITTRTTTLPFDDSSSRMLDIFYVLAGTGVVTTADGSLRRLHSGDSLIAWHNTTTLCADSSDQPPAVLKFHFPSHVLMLPPGTAVAPSPSHADLAVLVTESQGPPVGQISQQEAADMMSGVQQRTSRAINRLYDNAVQGPESRDENSKNNKSNISNHNDDTTTTGMMIHNIRPDSSSEPAVPQKAASAATLLRGLLPPMGFLRRLVGARRRGGAGGGDRGVLEAEAVQHQARERAVAVSGSSSSSGGGPVEVRGSSGCVLLQRALEDFKAFRFPRQTNKMAFVFDPSELGLSLSFGVEVFEPGHRTPLHLHRAAHELFFVLGGAGIATCNGQRFPVAAGDVVVFPPRAIHGIDNPSSYDKLYCLQLMTPNEAFVEHVKSGEAVGRLDDEDLCNLTSRHC